MINLKIKKLQEEISKLEGDRKDIWKYIHDLSEEVEKIRDKPEKTIEDLRRRLKNCAQQNKRLLGLEK